MAKNKVEIKPIAETRPYVLWRRVSTREQGESGLGLEAQLTIAKMFMGREPAEMFTDVYSGTKLKQCKGLWEAIDVCKHNNYVLVIAKTDRCRNVHEALDIVDSIGERNVIFCDLPTTDRFVLTILFAVWERMAIMGRINTKIALAERKRQIREHGGFLSKSGRFCDHLGNKKGEGSEEGIRAMAEKNAALAEEWKESSSLYSWVAVQLLKGRTQKDILIEAAELYDKNPEKYSTRRGTKLAASTLSTWASKLLKKC